MRRAYDIRAEAFFQNRDNSEIWEQVLSHTFSQSIPEFNKMFRFKKCGILHGLAHKRLYLIDSKQEGKSK